VTKPWLTIYIPTYRGGARLKMLFQSMAESRDDYSDVELLVFDDGSPYADAYDILNAMELSPVHSSNRRLLRRAENRGILASVREMLPHARGLVLLQLDDDVRVPPGLLPTVDALMSSLSRGTGSSGVGALSWKSRGTQAGQSEREVPGYLQPATQLASYCMAFTREAHDAVGGFDARFRTYCGDSDFCLRLTLAGRPCYRVWWPLVPHDEHGAFKAAPELDRNATASADLAAFAEKWGASGAEMEARALAALGA